MSEKVKGSTDRAIKADISHDSGAQVSTNDYADSLKWRSDMRLLTCALGKFNTRIGQYFF
jgi:hypothetical protein